MPRVARTWIAIATLIAVACSSPVPPSPSSSPVTSSSPSANPTTSAPTRAPAPTPPPKIVGDLELEMCDPEGLLPCEHQAVVINEPIAATGVSLTYSTEWADGRTDRPTWNADALGLGGWALDVLQRYDPERGILLSGDGSWRIAAAADLADGERAVPSYDGFLYFVFDAAWRHLRTIDSITGATVHTFTYDDAGRLASAAGHVDGSPIDLAVERDSEGRPTVLTGLEGSRTGLAVDSEGRRLTAIVRPDGTILSLDLGDFGLVQARRATGRGPTTYEYDATGRVVTETDADGVASEFAFEASPTAVTLTTTNAYGGTATMHVERSGEVLIRTFTAADGTITRLDTNVDGSTTYSEPDGTVTTTGSSPHPTWGLAAPILSPLVETRPDGTIYRQETTTTMGGGSVEPATGAWRTETRINGATYTEEYEPTTRTLSSTDPANRTTVQAYDELGRLVEEQAAGQPRLTYGFDDVGRLSSVAVGEDGADVTTFSYEGDALIARQPDGTTLSLRHDPMGNLIGVATEGESISLLLDNAGLPLQLRPGSHPATSVGYSDAGRPTAFIPPVTDDDLSYERTTYTPAGDVATIEGPGDRRIEMTYDAAGRVTGWTYDRGTASATYAADSGLLASISSPDGVSASYLYDGWVPVGLAWSGAVSGEVRRTVDSLLQPTAETINGGTPLEFGYDESGLLTSIGALALARHPTQGHIARASLGEGEVVYEYDDKARLVGIVASSGGGQVLGVAYTRDVLGRVIGVERTTGAGAEESVFTYDAAGRLASAERDGTTTTYQYDASGNRLSVDATYDDRDRLLASADATFAYAPDGTLLERRGGDGTTGYDFDDLGSLRSVDLPNGGRIEYVVDASGRRIGRMRDGVLTEGYLYDVEDRIVAWTDGSGQVVARFAYDDLGRLALVERDGQELLVVTDQLGSPIALLDGSNGELVAQMTYDAWGNLLADSQPTLIPFGFAGGLLDRDTGLLHYGAREYDPSVGRWTAPDPLRYGGGDINLYRYAFGDPVNLVDPTGTSPCRVGGCGASAGDAVRSPNDAGGKRAGGGRPGGGGAKTPKGALDCQSGVCVPSDPKKPNRPSNSVDCTSGYCVPSDASKNSGGPKDYERQDKPGSPVPNIIGEPHVITLDGVHYGFQAAGEFIVTASADELVQVQARFEPPPTVTTVTRATGLALLVNGDRVAFYANPDRALVVNGEVIDRAEYARTLPGGGVIERHGTEALVVWPDGTTLGAHVYARFINFGLEPSAAVAASLIGIIGDRDGDPADDLATRAGQVVDPDGPNFEQLLYGEFASSWRISQEESLFDYLPGETTETFQLRDIPTEPATIDSLDEATRANAEVACRAAGIASDPVLSDCILDVGMTGDPTYAGSAATVDAALERDGSSVVDLGTAVEVGRPVTGQLAAGSIDRYHVTAAAGDIVYLDAGDTCDPALDWRLSRPDGTLTTFAIGCDDIGRRLLDPAGEWLIDVYSDDGAAGGYSFQVLSVPQPTQQPISIGQSIAGTTTSVGEWHRYTLSATAGQVVFLDAEGSCDSPIWWRLLNTAGTLHTFARACTDMGRRVLDVAGDWVIEFYADDQSTGAYAFRVIDVPGTRESSIRAGDTVTDATSRAGEWHRYRLAATAGDVLYLDALGECVPGLFWRLLDTNETLRTFAVACSDMRRVVLDTTGDWFIEVYADDLSFGAYSFHVIAAPPVKSGTIALGQNVSGTIAAVGEWHRYTLTAQAGQSIVVDAQGECVPDLWWRLLRPDGTLVTFASTCTDSTAQTLETAGDWMIEIYSDLMATGAYSLTVNPAP